MKIILSRKGFDAGAGGYPSPLFIEENRLLSLPIPEENKIYSANTGRLYSDLQYDDTTTYLDIMTQLGMKDFINQNAHVDPDINPNVLKNRKPGWRGLFGQCDIAQKHLLNNGVEIGDLFLFFGWFKNVIKYKGKYKYIPSTEKHIIWGYMQVGEIDSIGETTEYEPWKLDHPHYRNRKRKLNTGYIAKENLDFSPGIPGCGVFNYDDSLVLTDINQKNKSIWRLPSIFHPSYGAKITYHEDQKRWELHDDHCKLNSVPRGQEFIITGNNNAVDWVKGIIIKNKKPQIEISKIKTKEGNLNNLKDDNIVLMTCYRKATKEKFTVKFNLEDMDKIKQFDEWKIEKNNNKVYANIGTVNTYLHRLIYGECKGKSVFAKNGDYFDCTRDNLYVKP